MIALALQTTVPASTLPGGVDAGQAMTFVQWLSTQGPYALVAVVVLVVIGCCLYWISKWIPRVFELFEKAMQTRADEHKAMCAENAAAAKEQYERHLRLVETIKDEGQANREAFREERTACDERARLQADGSRRDVESLGNRLVDELRRATDRGAR